MRQWIDQGRVAADSLVWREGWAQWQAASSTFPQLNSSVPSPAPAVATAAVATVVPATVRAATPLADETSSLVLGPSSTTATSSSAMTVKKSNGMTAVVVTILVVVAIILMVIFFYVLLNQGGQQEYNEARLRWRRAPLVQPVLLVEGVEPDWTRNS
jgi:hypothetical protein